MTLECWNKFIDLAHNVSRKHPSLFQTDDRSVIEEYLSFHHLHGNLHFVCDKANGSAFIVIHPIINPEDEFDWQQVESNTYKVDVFYSESKTASMQLLKQIIQSDKRIQTAYSYRKGRIVPWNIRVIKKFLYGQKESTRTS